MSVCTWSFTLCTEQPSSTLTIQIITKNAVPSGNNQIIIGYSSLWTNHNTKNLMFGVNTFTCWISLDGGINYSNTGINCSNSYNNSKITLQFYTSGGISSNFTIYVQIDGVQSPPTQITPVISSFSVTTTDSAGNYIDTITGCSVNPICVTNLTNGIFSTSPMIVNSILV
jgi:hypothetical protein